MISVVALLVVTLAALVTALVILVRSLGSAGQSLPVTAEWIEELSIERYRPMLRLLDSSDLEFLRSQPGYSPRIESNLRAQRCHIFRGYLRCLNTDFRRVCMALKLVMAQSQQDRPDLASVLVHHQIMFTSGMVAIQARLFLYRWGICTVDVSSLVQIFDVMRLELRTMMPTAVAACA
jgi:hypothetical protein